MARTFAALLSADLVTRGLAAVATVIAVRALAPDAFGQVAFALATAAVLGVVVDLGLSLVLVRDVSERPGRASGLLGAALRLEALLGLVIFGGAAVFALAGVAPGPTAGGALAIGLGVMAVNSLIRPFEATLTGLGRAHLVTVAHTVRGSSLVVATGLAALLDPTPIGFLGAALAAELVGLGTLYGLCRVRGFAPRLRVSGAEVWILARRAFPFALLVGFGLIYLRIDLIMLGLLGDDAEVGNYAFASRALETALAVPAFFGGAFLATVAQTGAGSGRAARQTAQALRYVLIICVPLALAIVALADPLVSLLAGERYSQAAEVLRRLSPVLVLSAAYAVLANLQVALDRAALLVRISLAGVVVKVALNAWAIPRYGANGAALAAVGGEALVVVAQWHSARGDFDAAGTLRWCLRLAAAGALMAAAGLAASPVLGWPGALAAGVAVFTVAALALRCISPSEARSALRSALGRKGAAHAQGPGA